MASISKLPAPYNAMSEDAMSLLKNIFAFGDKDYSLTFGNIKTKPTARAEAALSELVEKGVLRKTQRRRTVEYSILRQDQDTWKRLPKFASARGFNLVQDL